MTALTKYKAGELAVVNGAAMVATAINEMGVGLFDLEKLRVPGSGGTTWEVPSLEGTTPHKKLELVITNVRMSQRAWYRTDADEGAGGPPDCGSTDGVNGFGFRELGEQPEGARPTRQECSTCAWGEWGSDRDGGKGQDCREFAWVIGFPKDSALPIQLSVPRTSLKPLRAYLMKLMAAGLKPQQVVSALTLKKIGSGATAYSVIEFGMAGVLDAKESKVTDSVSEICKALFTRTSTPATSTEPSAAAEGLD